MPTFALNFYNPAVADQLRSGRKPATIRLGDKSAKYKKGLIVTVLCGARFGQRERIFDAVIDKVEVKELAELSPREREVLELMAQGRTNTAIGRIMVITQGAVEKHISSIFTKLALPPSSDDHRRVMAVLAWLEG